MREIRKTLGYSILIWFVFAQSCGAAKLPPPKTDLDPQQILNKLVPEVPGLTIVPPKDLEPNPPGPYHRSAFIRGDFNGDRIEDIAICGTDEWVKKGRSQTRNGYVLIASKRDNGTSKRDNGNWGRVFFHKFTGIASPFLIWDRMRRALLVGANFSDANPGDIVWDPAKREYRLVRVVEK